MSRAKYHAGRRLSGALSRLQGFAEREEISHLSLINVVAASNGMDTDDPAVLGQLSAIFELPRQIARDLSEMDSRDLQYAGPGVRVLQDALSPSQLQTPWVELYRDIESKGMPALAICSLLLEGHSLEAELDRVELKRIGANAQDLLEEIRAAKSIPIDVRNFVESALLSLLAAIDAYWLKGASAIEDSIDQTIGKAIREGRFTEPEEKVHPFLRRLGGVLASAAIVLAMSNDLLSLPKTVNDVVSGVIRTDDSGKRPSVAPSSSTIASSSPQEHEISGGF